MSTSEKKSAQIIAIDAHKVRAVDGGSELHKPTRYGYCMAGYGFLVGERALSEVIIDPTVFPMPKAPEWLLGLTNLRGNIVPVFDLWKFIRTQKPVRLTPTVLVLDLGDAPVGLVIDNLPKPVPLDSQPVHTLPPAPALQPFLKRGIHALGCEWWEFDYQQFLAHLASVDSR